MPDIVVKETSPGIWSAWDPQQPWVTAHSTGELTQDEARQALAMKAKAIGVPPRSSATIGPATGKETPLPEPTPTVSQPDLISQALTKWGDLGPRAILDAVEQAKQGNYAKAAHGAMTGAGVTIGLPLLAGAAGAAAVEGGPALAALGTTMVVGAAATKAVEKGAKMMGLTPDQAAVAGDLAGLGAGTYDTFRTDTGLGAGPGKLSSKTLGHVLDVMRMDPDHLDVFQQVISHFSPESAIGIGMLRRLGSRLGLGAPAEAAAAEAPGTMPAGASTTTGTPGGIVAGPQTPVTATTSFPSGQGAPTAPPATGTGTPGGPMMPADYPGANIRVAWPSGTAPAPAAATARTPAATGTSTPGSLSYPQLGPKISVAYPSGMEPAPPAPPAATTRPTTTGTGSPRTLIPVEYPGQTMQVAAPPSTRQTPASTPAAGAAAAQASPTTAQGGAAESASSPSTQAPAASKTRPTSRAAKASKAYPSSEAEFQKWVNTLTKDQRDLGDQWAKEGVDGRTIYDRIEQMRENLQGPVNQLLDLLKASKK